MTVHKPHHRVTHAAHPYVPPQTSGAVASAAAAATAATGATSSSVQPATAASPTSPSSANATSASQGASSGASSSSTGAAASSQQQGIAEQQGLAALKQQFGTNYEDPIVASDGTVYMEQRQPALDQSGNLVLRYIRVGTVKSGTLYPDQNFLQQQASQLDPNGKPVEINNQYYWQSTQDDGKGDGGLSATLTPLNSQQLQALQQQSQQQQAQQNLQTSNQSTEDWMQKLESTSGWMKTIGFTGSFLQGMGAGPNPMTGAPSAHWLTGYMILQMLNGQSGGKLLPKAMQTGVMGTVLNYAMQGMFFLQTPHDIKVLAQAFPHVASVMRTFTAPTRAVINGVRALGTKVDETIPGSVETAAASDAAKGAASASTAAARAAASAATAGAAADGMSANVAADLGAGPSMGVGREIFGQLGQAGATEHSIESDVTDIAARLKSGAIEGVVGGTGFQNMSAVVTKGGKLEMVDSTVLHAAAKEITPAVEGADKIQRGIDGGMNGMLKSIIPALGPLKVMGGLFGAVAGALDVELEVKNYGAKSLIDTKDGRSALLGMLGSVAFLGLMALPSITLGPEVMPIVASAMNVATNIFYGVDMINSDGLFGGGGWLDHDGVRAIFLIPPLTPFGIGALLLKRHDNKLAAQQAALQQQQQSAVTAVQQLRANNQSQLQQSGSIQGGQVQSDGSIAVPTSINNNLAQGQSGNAGLGISSSLGHLMTTIGRPIEYITH